MIANEISETAWVVPDLAQAMKSWIALGYGPFFTMRLDIPDAHYRGRRLPLSLDVALAWAGGVQIELIEQRSDGPSAYRDIYGPSEGGFHHIRLKPGDYDAHRERLIASGAEIVMELVLGTQRILYADMRPTLGHMVEILDASPILDRLYAMMVEATRDWDGSEPVRAVDLAAIA